MRCISVVVLSWMLGLATGVAIAADPPPVVYACSDGSSLRVQFVDGAARVTLPDGSVLRLPQQRAASGIWYADARHELRGKGDDATWTASRRAPVSCRAKP